METITIPGQTTYRMSPEVQRRLSKFRSQNPLFAVNTVIDRAVSFYLDFAERGVDSNLNPIKLKKV